MGVENWKDICNFWNSRVGMCLGSRVLGSKLMSARTLHGLLEGLSYILLTCKVRVVSSQLLPGLQRALWVNQVSSDKNESYRWQLP